jgi:hypothetical protein
VSTEDRQGGGRQTRLKRECAAGGRDNASRQVAESTPTSPRIALLRDLKRRLEGRISALAEQNKEIGTTLAELEAESKDEGNHCRPQGGGQGGSPAVMRAAGRYG